MCSSHTHGEYCVSSWINVDEAVIVVLAASAERIAMLSSF